MLRNFHNYIKYSIWSNQQCDELLTEQIKNNDIVIVGLTWCPWTRRSKKLIQENYGKEPIIIAPDLVSEEYKISVLQSMCKKTNTINVAQIWIKGEHIGDFEKLYKMHSRNQIKPKLFL